MDPSTSETTKLTYTEDVHRQDSALNRAVLDSLTAHIAVLDDAGTIITVNQAWECFARENGDPTLAHTGVGQNYLAVLRRATGALADEAMQALEGMQGVLTGSQPHFSLEYPCRSPAEQRWFSMQVTPLGSGQRGAVVSHADITERKLAEQALQESEVRFRTMWESAADAMVLSDAEGIVLAANPAYVALYGYPLEAVIGQDFAMIFPEEARAWAREQYEEIFAIPEPGPTFESTIRRADGTERIVESRIEFLTENGRRTAMLSIIRDITERKQAEDRQRFLAEVSQALAVSLDYEKTIRNIAHLAVPHLADWCVVHIAGEEQAYLDFARTPVVIAHTDPEQEAQAYALWQRYPPDPHAAYGLAQVFRTGQPELVTEITDALLQAFAQDPENLRILRKTGLKSYLIVPLQVRGRTIGTLTWITAESGRRYGSADLAVAEEVAHRAAQAVDNARLYAWAQQALRGRDEFLSIVSHDLKNPLMTIQGYAQLLERRLAQGKTPDAERFGEGLARIDTAATKMVGLVNQLLDLGQLQAGRELPLHLQPTDLGKLLEQVLAEHKLQAEGYDLQVEGTDEELVGIWDTERLDRVINNIVSNAIKYSPEGSEILLRVGREENWAVLSVQDQGIGIPAEDLPHIFERFHRAKNVTGRIPGTGIGLSGARQIVEQHGGTIEVVSREGAGSTFIIRLPLA